MCAFNRIFAFVHIFAKYIVWFSHTNIFMCPDNYNHNSNWKGDHKISIYCLFQHLLHSTDGSR